VKHYFIYIKYIVKTSVICFEFQPLLGGLGGPEKGLFGGP
jgi:hypothetical protein